MALRATYDERRAVISTALTSGLPPEAQDGIPTNFPAANASV